METLTEFFVSRVDAFLERTGLGPTTLGRQAVGDPNLVRQLRDGRSPTLATVDHCLAFMEAFEATPIGDRVSSRAGRLRDSTSPLKRGVTPVISPPLLRCAAGPAGLELRVGLSLKLCQTIMGTQFPPSAIRQLRLPRLVRTQLAFLDPVHGVITQHTALRGVSGRSLLLWTITGWGNRTAFLILMIRGRRSLDPEKEPPRTHPVMGSWKILELLVYNLLVCVRAAVLAFSSDGRRSLRFWSFEEPCSATRRRDCSNETALLD